MATSRERYDALVARRLRAPAPVATKTVVVDLVSPYFGADEGRECEQIGRPLFYNGEHHLQLRDPRTGERFESPAIFWVDKR